MLLLIVACNKTPFISPKEIPFDSNRVLTFEDESSFQKAIERIRNGESLFAVTRSTETFKSLYDEFYQAMTEADDYYLREGGYEEFKEKFPDLFYPEHGEDYSAFLPVSDEAIAKLLNPAGKVIISGKERDFRDIWTYEKLQELGLGIPDKIASLNDVSTRAFTDMKTLTLDKQNINSKRKAWITLRGIKLPDYGAKIGRVDLCFRKKGVLGWYNGMMTSESYIKQDGKRIPYNGGIKDKEYSPHKYTVAARPISMTSSNYGKATFYFECGADDLDYSFTGVFSTDVDALLDMNNGTGIGEDIANLFKNGYVEFSFAYRF